MKSESGDGDSDSDSDSGRRAKLARCVGCFKSHGGNNGTRRRKNGAAVGIIGTRGRRAGGLIGVNGCAGVRCCAVILGVGGYAGVALANIAAALKKILRSVVITERTKRGTATAIKFLVGNVSSVATFGTSNRHSAATFKFWLVATVARAGG